MKITNLKIWKGEVRIHWKKLIKYVNNNVAIGVEHYSKFRNAPFFFFGNLLEVNENNLLLELHNDGGFKSIKLEQVVDIHLDRKYTIKKKFRR